MIQDKSMIKKKAWLNMLMKVPACIKMHTTDQPQTDPAAAEMFPLWTSIQPGFECVSYFLLYTCRYIVLRVMTFRVILGQAGWNLALWMLFNPIFIAFLVELKTRPLVFSYHFLLFSCLEGQEPTTIRMDWVCQVSIVGQVSCWLLNTLIQVF